MRAHSPRRAGLAGRDSLAAARAGEHPGVIAKLRSGFVTMGDSQFLPGYCVLLADSGPAGGLPGAGLPEGGLPETGLPETGLPETGLPETGLPETGLPGAGGSEAEHLTDLPRPARTQLLTDLGLLGEALAAACPAWDPAFSRLDYEILGNPWRQLRAQVFPRYAWEPVELRDGPVWAHPPDRWTDPAYALGPGHDRLVEAITRELSRVLAEAY